ncbi:MAG: hypothetical protein QOH21_2762 [Acidobacteriota bacterium]|jgi:hypothetical protein|nr:hypothetical protein [Acidobacteriota bacterium]
MPRFARDDGKALALLALLASLFFAELLTGQGDIYLRDVVRYYHPAKHVLREIVLGGEFPYWNPYFSAGQPIAANPEHEVFYPLTWLILLPDYETGFRLLVVSHIYIALFAMYAFLRSLAVRAPAAFFGALAFGLGGLCLSNVNLLPCLFPLAWLPLTCLYTRRFLLDRQWRDFALASLFFGIELLIGEPTTILQTGFLLGMYALYRHAVDRPPLRRAPLLGVAAISATAFLAGAAQMLPTLDHFRDSVRVRGFSFANVSEWSMPWIKLGELVYPNLLGHFTIAGKAWFWGGGVYAPNTTPFLFSIYSGLLVVVLAAAGLLARIRGSRFVLILLTFSIVVALGAHTPLLRLLYDAGVASTRFPEKFMLIGIFTLLVFSSQVLDRLLEGDARLRRIAAGLTIAVGAVAAVIAAWSLAPSFGERFLTFWDQPGGPGVEELLALVRRDWFFAVGRAAVLLLLLVTLPRLRRPLWLALLGLFVIADLAPVMYEITPLMPAEFLETTPPEVQRLPENRSAFRLFHAADWLRTMPEARPYFRRSALAYPMLRAGVYPHIPARYGIRTVMDRDYDRTALLPTADFTDAMMELSRKTSDWQRPLEAMSNVWYRALYRRYESEMARTGGDPSLVQPVAFVKVGEHPRYYFAEEIVPVRDLHAFVDAVASGKHSLRAAYVAEHVRAARGIVRGIRETANSATIDVESAGDGFLVISVTPHKYWRFTIDGRPARAVVTNIGYQGVSVPAGRHRVVMRYRNPVVLIGAAISALTVLSLLVLVSTMRALCTKSPTPRP